jgi:cytochrome c5
MWAPRIAKGFPALEAHALGGFNGEDGIMPPRGGNDTLSDGDVRAAVAYMVSRATD